MNAATNTPPGDITMLSTPNLRRSARRAIVISGGAGFIGANLADSFLAGGHDVIVIDNLSRAGVEENLDWLEERHGEKLHRHITDVRDIGALLPAFEDAKAVFHFAAQTAVTTSLAEPITDFRTNAGGTLNVLEAVRATGKVIPVIFASTNKVYGALDDIELAELDDRYLPVAEGLRAHGVDETRPLDFRTPYGCSKGVADQYILDYARSYGLPTAVLRMSCIYGPHQFGTEDQGWVAHFLIRALMGETISIYGDGKQVRDILHVSDAVAAYRAVLDNIETVKGNAFNLGGGPQNAISLNMLLAEIGRIMHRPPVVDRGEWRPGDQLYFVADTRRITRETGWKARMGWRDGVADLAAWLMDHRCSQFTETPSRRVPA